MKLHRGFLLFLIAAVFAIGAYAGTIRHELLWDDPIILKYAQNVHRAKGLGGLLKAEFSLDEQGANPTGYYRPVPLLSFWTDHLVSSRIPYSFHATNILLHALNSGLVFIFLGLFLSRPASIAGALVFAVHPAHTESVAFVSGRTDLWATFFALLCAVTWIRKRVDGVPVVAASGMRMLVVAVSFILAALSKEVAILLPLVLLAYDFMKRTTAGEPPLGWIRRNLVWIALFAGSILVVYGLRFFVAGVGSGFGNIGIQQFKGAHSTFLFPLVVKCLVAYARLLVFPWPLNAYYTLDQIAPSLKDGIAIVVLAGLLAMPFPKGQPKTRLLAFLWITVFIMPVVRIFPFSGAVIAERFLYLPSVGYVLLLGSWFQRVSTTTVRRAVAFGVVFSVAGLMAIGTVSRNAVWRDPLTFFTTLAAVSPDPVGPRNLAQLYLDSGHPDKAVSASREALRRSPGDDNALYDLGVALGRLGRLREAQEAYQKSIAIKPKADSYTNLAVVVAMQGDYERAVLLLQKAIEIDPAYFGAWYNLALAHETIGNRKEAVRLYEETIRRDPGYADAYYRLGRILIAEGNKEKALAQAGILRRLNAPLALRLASEIDAHPR